MLSPNAVAEAAAYMPPMATFYPAQGTQHPGSAPYAFAPMSTVMYAPNGLPNGTFYPIMSPTGGPAGPAMYGGPASAASAVGVHFTPVGTEAVVLPLDKMDLTVASDGMGSIASNHHGEGNNASGCGTPPDASTPEGHGNNPLGRGGNAQHILQSNNTNGTKSGSEEGVQNGNPTEYFVMVHVNGGETFSVKVGGQLQNIQGPATVRMVSKKGPPMLMPMQVPPGHLVQQIVDENGVLTHVILSPYPPPPVCPTISLHSAPQGPVILPMNMTPFAPTMEGENPFSPSGMNELLGNRYAASAGEMSGVNGDCGDGFVNGVHTWIQDSVSQQHRGRSWGGRPLHEGSTGRGRLQRKKGKGNAPTSAKNPSLLHVYRRSDFHNTSSSGDETGGTNNHNTSIIPQTEDMEEMRPGKHQNSGPPFKHTNSTNYKHSSSNSESSAIRKLLSATPPPQVSDVEARSVSVQLYPPEPPEDCSVVIDPLEFTYELFLSENGPDAYYKCVFRGEAMEISIRDLKPNLEYYIKAATRYGSFVGNRTTPVRFKTEPSEPNAPKSPVLVQRTRCELALKWANTPDNGSKLHSFILEMKQAIDVTSEWMEVYNGPQHYCKINKLIPATEYTFRLCATNSYGQSPWSEEACYSTCGLAPSQPSPPQLVRQEVHGLGLSWNKRPIDEKFQLEMEDEATCHGFIPVFLGDQLSHFFENLRRNTRYRFRLAAENVEGRSQWSEVVTYTTLPDAPSPPKKLEVKGKLQATKFHVMWSDVEDDGGSAVDSYRVQVCYCMATSPLGQRDAAAVGADEGVKWTQAYEGSEAHCQVTNATAGAIVWLRVAAHSAGGWGKWSSLPLRIRLPPVAPGVVGSVRTHTSKTATGNRLMLLWNKPEKDGGAEALTYEVQEQLCESTPTDATSTSPTNPSTADDHSAAWSTVYEGKATECGLQPAVPGCEYHYRVRCKNELSLCGPWSEPPLRIRSDPLQPMAPAEPPSVVWCSANASLQVTWEPPAKCNGAPVTEYRLEMRQAPAGSKFSTVYSGKEKSFEVRQSLEPATAYVFRVQAFNVAGCGPFSPESKPCYTGASVPGLVSNVSVSPKPSDVELEMAVQYLEHCGMDDEEHLFLRSVLLDGTVLPRMDLLWVSWKEAPSHGSPLTSYTVEWRLLDGTSSLSQESVTATRCFHVIRDLCPQSNYKVRVRAENAEGSGPFSTYQRATTISSPPPPPVLECLLSQVSALKLRWSSLAVPTPSLSASNVVATPATESSIRYQLDMSRSLDSGWQNVYSGSCNTYKVQKLLENTEYFFRIRAANNAGSGEWSTPYRLTTAKAPPPYPRTLRVADVSNNGALVDWSPVKIATADDTVLYVLQMLNVTGNELEYKQVYRGSATTYCLHDLSPGTEYLLRVCALRFCAVSPISSSSPGTEDQDNRASCSEDQAVTATESDSEQRPRSLDSESMTMRDIVGPFSPPISFTTVGRPLLSDQSHAPSQPPIRAFETTTAVQRKRRAHPQHHTAASHFAARQQPHHPAQNTKEAVEVTQAASEERLRRWWWPSSVLSWWQTHEFSDTEVASLLLVAFVLLLILVGFLAQAYLL